MAETKGSVENKILFDALKQPLAPPSLGPEAYGYIRLHNNILLTAHYYNPATSYSFPIPRVPIFHPYNPLGDEVPAGSSANRAFGGLPATTIAMRLPAEVRSFLPDAVKKALDSLGVIPEKLEFYFTTQNMPWDARFDHLLARFHYWVHGNPSIDASVRAATFSEAPLCDIGVFPIKPSPISLADSASPAGQTPQWKQNEMAGKFAVSSHSHEEPWIDPKTGKQVVDQQTQKPLSTRQTICSPPGVPGGLMNGIDFNTTQSFFSIVKKPGGRIAVTLHWLLNPADQEALTRISKRNNDVVDADILKLLAERPYTLLEVLAEIEKLGKTSQLNADNGPMSDLKKIFGIAGMDLASTYAAETKAGKAEKIEQAGKKETPEKSPLIAVPLGLAEPVKVAPVVALTAKEAPVIPPSVTAAPANQAAHQGEDIDLALAISESTADAEAKKRAADAAALKEKEELALAQAASLSLTESLSQSKPQSKSEGKQAQEEYQKQLDIALAASMQSLAEIKQGEEKKRQAAVAESSTLPGMIKVLEELSSRLSSNLEAMTKIAEELEAFEGVEGSGTTRAHAKLSDAVDRAENLAKRLLEARELEPKAATLSPEELKTRMDQIQCG